MQRWTQLLRMAIWIWLVASAPAGRSSAVFDAAGCSCRTGRSMAAEWDCKADLVGRRTYSVSLWSNNAKTDLYAAARLRYSARTRRAADWKTGCGRYRALADEQTGLRNRRAGGHAHHCQADRCEYRHQSDYY